MRPVDIDLRLELLQQSDVRLTQSILMVQDASVVPFVFGRPSGLFQTVKPVPPLGRRVDSTVDVLGETAEQLAVLQVGLDEPGGAFFLQLGLVVIVAR